jgi:hypothetical protein
MIKLLPVFLFTLFSFLSYGQDTFSPQQPRKDIPAKAIQQNLKIDGKLDESEWAKAQAILLDFEVEPLQGEKAKHPTHVKILYNQSFLYIAGICYDSLGKNFLRAPDFKRDFELRSHDAFGVTIDGFNDKRNAMAMVTNPYGTQRDLLAFDDRLYDLDWDGLWRVRTARSDSGWVAEIAIPWQTLRYPKTSDAQSWGINFFRNRRYTNATYAWSPYPRSFSVVRMDYAGTLSNLQAPPPSATNIRFIPYTLFSYDNYNGSEYENPGKQTKLKLGGEIKWAINPNTVLDLTFNTDFAQADADRQVNNVTRFSVFFPERRQFFLENASLFGAGLSPIEELAGGAMRIQPFFSRRIGLDNNAQPVAIDAGARMVYRSLKRNIGAIAIRQRATDDLSATNFFVGRYSENIGSQNRIGTLITVKNTEAYNNITGSVDGFFRLSNVLSLNSMAMFSQNSNESSAGFAGYNQFLYKNNHLVAWYTQSIVTDKYNPEMGFVSRNNVIANAPGFYLTNRGKWRPTWVRSFEPGLFTEFYHSATTGQLVERQLNFNPVWINLQSGGFGGIFYANYYQRLEEVFAPLGIEITPREYRYNRVAVILGSDASKKVSYFFNHEMGGYYNGRLDYTQASIKIAPTPHASFNIGFENNGFEEVGDKKESKSVQLYSIESRLALNPRVQLIGFYQKNTQSDRDTWNIRFSWEYRPLSYIYLVFNQRGFIGTDLSRQREQHIISKISYLKQF